MKRKLLAVILALVASVLAVGCGGGGEDFRAGVDPNDHRALALACLTKEKDLTARAVNPDSIQVDEGSDGPRIRFYTNSGEAEAEQIEGNGEGSEAIGRALLFTRGGSDDLLKEVEDCLADL